MVRIAKPGQAGTMESNDIFITVAPAKPGSGITIELTSPVMIKYGRQIIAVIKKMLMQYDIADAAVGAIDKGALDCTIRARLQTAISRAIKEA